MDTLFKITHAGTFNTSIQALQLIFQVSQARQVVSDRFYRTLYDSLFDSRLVTSSKQAMYLNLLFKALKADASLPRVMAFVKRLLQMLGLHQPPFICGALYLLGEVGGATGSLPFCHGRSGLTSLVVQNHTWSQADAHRARGQRRGAFR